MSWTGRLALVLLATLAVLVAFAVPAPATQATHATDGETLAWVESHDGFDASAGLVDAAVADRPTLLVATAASQSSAGGGIDASLAGEPPPVAVGACRARVLAGVPPNDPLGCDLPKLAGDLPELEPPRPAPVALAPEGRRAPAAPADPTPPQAPRRQPLRPPSA
jgi:hypothetical protein